MTDAAFCLILPHLLYYIILCFTMMIIILPPLSSSTICSFGRIKWESAVWHKRAITVVKTPNTIRHIIRSFIFEAQYAIRTSIKYYRLKSSFSGRHGKSDGRTSGFSDHPTTITNSDELTNAIETDIRTDALHVTNARTHLSTATRFVICGYLSICGPFVYAFNRHWRSLQM